MHAAGAYGVGSVNEGRIVFNVDKRLHPYIVDRWNGGHEEKVRQSYGMKGVACKVYEIDEHSGFFPAT